MVQAMGYTLTISKTDNAATQTERDMNMQQFDFAAYEALAAGMTNSELHYATLDAVKIRDLWSREETPQGCTTFCKYADQVHVLVAERNQRTV